MRVRFPLRKDGRQAEPLLPMIDVVFFLIIFFMMVPHFAEPEPFAVARPVAGADGQVAGEGAVYVSAAGQVAVAVEGGVAEDDAAIAALAARCTGGSCGPVLVHADAAAPARAVAALLSELAAAGLADLRLVTVRE